MPKLKQRRNETADLNVAKAHWQIEGRSESVLPADLSKIQNPELTVSDYRLSYEAIQEMNIALERVVPSLVQILKIERKKRSAIIVRLRGAIELLATYGPVAKSALPDLQRIATSGKRYLEKQKLAAIERIE